MKQCTELPLSIIRTPLIRVIDLLACRVFNARNAGREWNSIDRLNGWLRDQGFWCWWTRNDLEPVGSAQTEIEEPGELTSGHFPEPPLPL